MKKALSILIVCVVIWCIGIVTPAIILTLFPAGRSIADIVYRIYGVVCHQFDSRSFHIHGHAFAVCIRCTAIYAGFLLSLIALRTFPGLYKKHYDPMTTLLCSLFPMALDVLCSFTPLYQISTPSRLITGSIFGFGMALLLHRSLTETILSLIRLKYHELKTR